MQDEDPVKPTPADPPQPAPSLVPKPAVQTTPVVESSIVDPIVPVTAPPPSSAEQTRILEYAGFWIRLLALIIDYLILLSPLFVLLLVVGAFAGRDLLWIGDSIAFVLAVGFFAYNIAMITRFGGTIGKLLLGLRVVDLKGNYPNLPKSVLREIIGKWVSYIFYLGFIWVAFDDKKQGWHDKIAGTYVIKKV